MTHESHTGTGTRVDVDNASGLTPGGKPGIPPSEEASLLPPGVEGPAVDRARKEREEVEAALRHAALGDTQVD